MRLDNAHLLTTKKQNAMNKQEILDIVINYEKQLRNDYEELRDNYGSLDSATQSAFKEWNTIDELINRLDLQNETI